MGLSPGTPSLRGPQKKSMTFSFFFSYDNIYKGSWKKLLNKIIVFIFCVLFLNEGPKTLWAQGPLQNLRRPWPVQQLLANVVVTLNFFY